MFGLEDALTMGQSGVVVAVVEGVVFEGFETNAVLFVLVKGSLVKLAVVFDEDAEALA